MERTLQDPQNAVGPKLFTLVLSQEIHKAIRLQYPVSLLCLTPDHPPTKITSPLIHRLAALTARRIRATDLAATVDPSTVAILFVDAETRNLEGILNRLREELEPGLGLTVSAGGGCYPETAFGGAQLLQQAIELMRRAKVEGGDRLCLPT